MQNGNGLITIWRIGLTLNLADLWAGLYLLKRGCSEITVLRFRALKIFRGEVKHSCVAGLGTREIIC